MRRANVHIAVHGMVIAKPARIITGKTVLVQTAEKTEMKIRVSL